MNCSLETLNKWAKAQYQYYQATPQLDWPQLKNRLGFEVWVKHENCTPVGSFKVRGALCYLLNLKQTQPDIKKVICATRGNFGQGVAYAASHLGLEATIITPLDNCPDKNKSMTAFGAEVILAGVDFQESVEIAQQKAVDEGFHLVPSYAPELIYGTAAIGLELFQAVPNIDVLYTSIGLGSNICGLITARDALKLSTKIIGVVTETYPAYLESLKSGKVVASESTAPSIAEGLACRKPSEGAFEIIKNGVDKIITVSETEIKQAIKVYFEDTHHLAEGAGAAPLAGLLKEKDLYPNHTKAGVILCGGNINQQKLIEVLTH